MDKVLDTADWQLEADGPVRAPSLPHLRSEGDHVPSALVLSSGLPFLCEEVELLDLLHDAVIARRADGTILAWNQAAADLYGLTPDALNRSLHPLLDSRFADDARDVVSTLDYALQTVGIWEGTLHQKGAIRGRVVEVRAAVARWDAARNPTIIVEICRDISDRAALRTALTEAKAQNTRAGQDIRRLRDELNRHAHYARRDALTGLLNRRAFHSLLDAAQLSMQNGGSPFAVLLMDLNNFKFFNDAYGHGAGDTVLEMIASALRKTAAHGLPHTNTSVSIARLGGDEFAVLLPQSSPREARRWITAAKDAVIGLRFFPPGHSFPVPITVSAGGAVVPTEAATATEALALADERLFHDKRHNRELWSAALRTHYSETVPGFDTMDAILRAVDAKDRYTLRHSEDVLIRSLHIGQEMKLSPEDLEWLQIAACLHDIGKVAVPDNLLRMPGPLAPDALRIVRQAPLVGAALLGSTPGLLRAALPVRHHHERWDGSGYPDGLQGDTIPLLSRILAVADAFSAMTTNRPYRHSLSSQEATIELQTGAGTQFDPACVAAFTRVGTASLHPL